MAMPEEVVHLIMLTFMPASAIRHPHNGPWKGGVGREGSNTGCIAGENPADPQW